MVTAEWVKSLQCKSRATDDVVYHKIHDSKHHHLISSSSCRKSVQNLKDVVETAKHKKPRNQPPPSQSGRKTELNPNPKPRIRPSTATTHSRHPPDPLFPALTKLPVGHPSRNVVEIIFHTSWSPKSFSGRFEMIFKVQNLPRTVTRFEEYREMVRSVGGGGENHARCVADGNEVMRFQCSGPSAGGPGYDCGGAWAFNGRKRTICTFSGSGEAHESAGGGRGRRAMLVCRVIAGRVCKQMRVESLVEGRIGYNSVSGESGELLVFDSRAVLPCFLIIYQL